jgi:hypothetical protein
MCVYTNKQTIIFIHLFDFFISFIVGMNANDEHNWP